MIATRRNMVSVDSNGADGVIAYSPATLEEYSANPRDYWFMSDDECLTDQAGEPMILMLRTTELLEL